MKWLLAAFMLLMPGALHAQTARDSLIANKIRYAKDSVYCSSANPYRDRCSRAKVVLDSIIASLRCGRPIVRQPGNLLFPWVCAPIGPEPVASVAVTFGPPTGAYYASGFHVDMDPLQGVGDTVTVCGAREDLQKVMWPPIRIQVVGDSAVPFIRGGNPIQQMCGPALIGKFAVTDSLPGQWSMEWLTIGPNGRRVYRPVFFIP